jgi:outer membrane protease
LANAGKLVFGGYNFGCTLKYNSTAQALTYDNYYSSTVDLYFRVYVKM